MTLYKPLLPLMIVLLRNSKDNSVLIGLFQTSNCSFNSCTFYSRTCSFSIHQYLLLTKFDTIWLVVLQNCLFLMLKLRHKGMLWSYTKPCWSISKLWLRKLSSKFNTFWSSQVYKITTIWIDGPYHRVGESKLSLTEKANVKVDTAKRHLPN